MIKLIILGQGFVPKTQQYERYQIVLYYYAVEEFGKTLKLFENKKFVEKHNHKIIDTEWFKDHDSKIYKVIEKYGKDMDILKPKEIPNDGKFHNVEHEDSLLKKYQEDRAQLLLANYDSNTKKWMQDIPMAIHYEIESKICKLEKIIVEGGMENGIPYLKNSFTFRCWQYSSILCIRGL